MEALKKARGPVRTKVTKVITALEEQLAKDVPNERVIKSKVNILETHYAKLKECDEKIQTHFLDNGATDAEIEEEGNSVDEYEEKYELIRVFVDEFLHPPVPVRAPSPSSVSSFETAAGSIRKKTYTLPKIQLRKFNGDVKEWLGFWAQFSKIHEDDDLHASDKFQYLAQSIVKDSPAEKVLECYPQSEANYPKVVAALQERFGNTEVLLDVYIRELIKLSTSLSDKTPLSSVYYKLESHMKSLESLGVTSEKWSYWLLPLIESGLPEEILRAWQRSPLFKTTGNNHDNKLMENLMKFLKQEVLAEERISRAKAGTSSKPLKKVKEQQKEQDFVATAAGLQISEKSQSCLFCDGHHDSSSCGKALNLSFEERKSKVQKSKSCYYCLKKGHGAKTCKVFVKCLLCEKKHHAVLCPSLADCKKLASSSEILSSTGNVSMLSQSAVGEVYLQTIMVKVKGPGGEKVARLLLDSGSQRSYIRSGVAESLDLAPIAVEWLSQTVFGGSTSAAIKHFRYKFALQALKGNFYREFEALDQPMICGKQPRLRKRTWLQELKLKNIWINDIGEEVPDIHILIGSDLYGDTLTGQMVKLDCGLVAMETVFGWTVMGRNESSKCSNLASHVIAMTITESSVPDMWSLETIGIQDPAENLSKKEREAAALAHFKDTVRIDEDGRYEVSLPWVAEKADIPSNETVAKKRLLNCVKKLQVTGYVQDYCHVFHDWLKEGIIEEVPADEIMRKCHYLPHRPVIKDSKTTPVRPVFDASCKVGRAPSLNDCLEKGPSMLELIPFILNRFREKRFGVISDIKKAFLTIGIDSADRDYLRFLWWENGDSKKQLKVYRHKRVVFGVNCSPFLLAAVIEHHLNSKREVESQVCSKLTRSLYVDNCVTSLDSWEEVLQFKSEATSLMAEAKMDLRLWEHSCTGDVSRIGSLTSRECGLDTGSADQEDLITMVLGLKWDKRNDTLGCDIKDFQELHTVTKRRILSVTYGIFDPMGFLSPALLRAKLILKEAWSTDCGWDDELPESIKKDFMEWISHARLLGDIKVPRWAASTDRSGWTLQVFCDASKSAYAAVVFLRCSGDIVTVQLLQSKARVSPPKNISICRLELLACVIGSRLASSIKEALNYMDIPTTYWSDSTTAIAWIKRNDDWGTFVGNRVREILKVTDPSQWKHVPGIHNPADLPSRGCTALSLLQSRWWEGPSWLKMPPSEWPTEEPAIDEAAVAAERKKTATILMSTKDERPWYAEKFSSYTKIVRLISWIKRYVENLRNKTGRRSGSLSAEEITAGEQTLLFLVQKEAFKDPKAAGDLQIVTDKEGLMRVETKVTRRDDDYNFRFPYLLPSNHIVVEALVREMHLKNCHAGVQILMVKLRENYWILRSRQVIRSVIRSCVRCRRFQGKAATVEPCALPLDRVRTTAACFQVTGVDLAGPLYLKDGRKAWIVLYTCAVYRAVHLELVLTLSTEGFLQSFRRFVARRGRPSVVYSDNGTNFQGAENLFRGLDWEKLEEAFGIQRIKWRFNPPGGPWWGGWWERLVQMVKKLLLRTLGKSSLQYEELETILCDVEALINARPLTYVSEDSNDLVTLTPAMFLHDIDRSTLPEVDILEQSGFEKRFRYRQKLREELRSRFRKEYLSQLVQRKNEKSRYEIQEGDVVIIASDNRKKLDWPLARVIKVIPGRDGKARVAQLKTANGELTRPFQRLHPLEVDGKARQEILEKPEVIEEKLDKVNRADPVSEVSKDSSCVETRYGRKVVKPSRYC